jgi:NAD(P)-dependent dehydrogenase (short-subunit alcohol dehydrogenase family)
MDVTGGTGRLQGKQVLVTGGTTGIGFAIAGRFLHEGARVMVTGPVRVYQDFATVDLLSHGRAEITAGRSAFTEPFGIFGADLPDYDALFSEKLDLLLHLRERPRHLVRKVPGTAG